MKHSSRRTINMCDYGPIYDRDGDMDCSQNFGYLLQNFFERKQLPAKRQKVTYEISIVIDTGNNPVRSTITKTRTFSYLCRLYKALFGTSFNVAVFKEAQAFQREAHEKEGERRAAWGAYADFVHLSEQKKGIEKFKRSIQGLPLSEQEEKIRAFKKGNSARLFIG